MEKSKSEAAFEAWYAKQDELPMPSECWEAAVEWIVGWARKEWADGHTEEVACFEDLEEMTK